MSCFKPSANVDHGTARGLHVLQLCRSVCLQLLLSEHQRELEHSLYHVECVLIAEHALNDQGCAVQLLCGLVLKWLQDRCVCKVIALKDSKQRHSAHYYFEPMRIKGPSYC